MQTLGRLSLSGLLCLSVGVGLLPACGDDTGSNTGSEGGSDAAGGEGPARAGSANSAGSMADNNGGAPDGMAGAPDGMAGAPDGMAGAPGGAGGMPDVPLNDAAAKYFDDMSVWGTVAPPSEMAGAPVIDKRMLAVKDAQVPEKKWPFSCSTVKHDVVEKHEEILNLDLGAEYVKPGLILSGNQFVKGNLSPIPLPRAPITLSINVPKVTTASVVIQNPTTASIQQGVAELQAQADAAAAGNYPAQLAYEQSIVQSAEEMSFKLGVTGSFDSGLASANFSTEFSSNSTREQYTVASKMLQSMYTITFAQDAIFSARDFFSPTMTLEQLLQAEDDGYLGPDDPPVFIGSVTYGRMVVFTATSTAATTAQNFAASVQAAGASWSGGTTFDGGTTSYLSNLKYKVLAIGGNQGKVTSAIENGTWGQLYGDADILSSVPLRYTVHALSGTRPVAAIGDTTTFTTSDCTAIEGWYDVSGPAGVTFTDVSTNPTNNPVLAVGRDGVNYRPYKLDGVTLVSHPSYNQSSGFVNVAVDDDGNGFMYDDFYQITWKMPANTFDWYPASDDNGVTGSSRGGHFDGFDAGAASFLVSSYPDGTYLTINKMTWNSPWAGWIGNAEGLEDGTGSAPYFSAVSTGYVGRHQDRGGLMYVKDNGDYEVLCANQQYLNGFEHFSAVTPSQVYAVQRGLRGKVQILDTVAQTFSDYAPAPPNASIKQLEATGNGRLWAVGDDGKIYGYTPGRAKN